LAFEPDTINDPVGCPVGNEPVGTSVNILLIVVDPVTKSEPVTWNVLPDANIKLLLFEVEVPFPCINAATADDDRLY
jgi:hypothetical protein